MRAYIGARIYPVDAPPFDDGVMLVDDGHIQEVGADVRVPDGVETVDLSGRVVIPGMVDAHSHAGMWGDGEGDASRDGNERPGPIAADVDAVDSVNPHHRSFASCREGGVTSVMIHPGSGNAIGGLCFAAKTRGEIVDDMVIRAPTGLKGALGENPKRGSGKDSPKTRMGTAALIRDYFARAAEYGRKKDADKDPDPDAGFENALRVLRGEIPFRVHAHRADDIVTATRLCEALDIRYNIEHCTDGYLLAEFLGHRELTAHVGPGLSSRGKVEVANRDERNAALLHAAGVRVCLVTDHPFLDVRYLMAYGGVAHKHGLPFDATLRALTLTPAESIGIADRVGSLAKGKDADFLVLAGEPFRYRSPILSTFVEGEEVYTRQQP